MQETALTYLGDLKQLLRDFNNVAQWLHILNACFDSISMPVPCSIHDIFDLLDLRICPLLVRWAAVFEDPVEDAEQAESDNRLLVDYIELIADRPDRDSCSGGQNSCLRNH